MKIELLKNVIHDGTLIEKGIIDTDDETAKMLLAAGDDIAKEIREITEEKLTQPDKPEQPAKPDKPATGEWFGTLKKSGKGK